MGSNHGPRSYEQQALLITKIANSVGTDGIGPSTSFLSGTRSTTEPSAPVCNFRYVATSLRHQIRALPLSHAPPNKSTCVFYHGRSLDSTHLTYCVHHVHNVHMARDVQKVAFTAFRNDLASYLEKLAKGGEIQIMNARRGKLIVSLVASGGKWVKKKTAP